MAKKTPPNAFEPGETNDRAVRGAPATPQRDRKDAARAAAATDDADVDDAPPVDKDADDDKAATPARRSRAAALPKVKGGAKKR